MADLVLSTRVNEQLAQQLVTEQAEVVRHQAVVDGIKKAIMAKKRDVILKATQGKLLKWHDKPVIVLEVTMLDLGEKFEVTLTFALEPTMALLGHELTKGETHLVTLYQNYFDECKYGYDAGLTENVICFTDELAKLKHQIELIRKVSWNISYDDSLCSRFYTSTGLGIDIYEGPNIKSMTLEETCLKRYYRK